MPLLSLEEFTPPGIIIRILEEQSKTFECLVFAA